MAVTEHHWVWEVRGMNSDNGFPATGPAPLPARLVPGRLIYIPRHAMFGARRGLDAELIEYRPTRAPNLGELHCVELATGHHYHLWVRPLLITALSRRATDLRAPGSLVVPTIAGVRPLRGEAVRIGSGALMDPHHFAWSQPRWFRVTHVEQDVPGANFLTLTGRWGRTDTPDGWWSTEDSVAVMVSGLLVARREPAYQPSLVRPYVRAPVARQVRSASPSREAPRARHPQHPQYLQSPPADRGTGGRHRRQDPVHPVRHAA